MSRGKPRSAKRIASGVSVGVRATFRTGRRSQRYKLFNFVEDIDVGRFESGYLNTFRDDSKSWEKGNLVAKEQERLRNYIDCVKKYAVGAVENSDSNVLEFVKRMAQGVIRDCDKFKLEYDRDYGSLDTRVSSCKTGLDIAVTGLRIDLMNAGISGLEGV